MCKWFSKSWQVKVLWCDHPTEFGRKSKKEKNTAMILTEKRTNQSLQNNNENKMTWKQCMVSGIYMEASFVVITFEKDKNCVPQEDLFLSHCRILTLSGGQALQ